MIGGEESTSTVIDELARDTPVVVAWATSIVQTPSASATAVLYAPDPATAVVNVVVGIALTTEPLCARMTTDACIDAEVLAVPVSVNPLSSGDVAATTAPEGPKVAEDGEEIDGRAASAARRRVVEVVEICGRVG